MEWRGRPLYLLILTFFGLTPEYRQAVFREIHDIVFFGRGGYSWETVYNMPIWLRRFTAKMIEQRIVEEYEAQKQAADNVSGVQQATPENSSQPQIPDVVKKASYSTTLAKK